MSARMRWTVCCAVAVTCAAVPGTARAAWRAYVSNFDSDNVEVFDDAGSHVATIGHPSFNGPVGMDMGPDGMIYVSQNLSSVVSRINPVTNSFDGTFVSSNLTNPEDPLFDSSGRLLVADWSDKKVERFLSNGSFDQTFVALAGAPGGLSFGPDKGGSASPDLYVGSHSDGTIKVFDADNGTFLQNFKTGLTGNLVLTVLGGPDLTGDGIGEVFVGGFGQFNASLNGSLGMYNGDTAALIDSLSGTVGSINIDNVKGMTLNPFDGKLYFASRGNNQVLRTDISGAGFSNLEVFASGSPLSGPQDIVFWVPEPSSMAIFVLGFLGLFLYVGRRQGTATLS